MALEPEPEDCLANMASLVILNEFDNFIGILFDLRVKKAFPKLEMIDELLKDKFKLENQKIAMTFTWIFFGLNFLNMIVQTMYYKHGCEHFD